MIIRVSRWVRLVMPGMIGLLLAITLGLIGDGAVVRASDFSYPTTDAPLMAQANASYPQQVVGLVNRVRSRSGLAPLQLNAQLTQAATAHAQDMAQHNFVGHTGSNGSSMQERVDATGYSWGALGENVAAGQATPQEVMRSWMGSEGHRQNILNPDFTEIGVAYQENPSAEMTYYWVQVFAKPQ